MNGTEKPKLTTSDQTLLARTRGGDQRAFAELWRRHFRSGARVARQFTSIDADDLVSEAYTRIYQHVLAGGSPTGAFRPYLYTTIRNLASTWGSRRRDVQVDDMSVFEDPSTVDDPAGLALDRTLTARAFRSLPERWQTVLWYTEVEGMDPHEVAPLLAMTPNGVAALSYRAREGLRKAWLQAHISDAVAEGECRWALSHLGEHARHGLGTRDGERMNFHLATCAKCAIVSEEVDEVGSRLALVMLPILLGSVAGGSLLATVGESGNAIAASAIPAVPELVGSGAGAAAGVFGMLGAATAPVAIIGSLAIVAGVASTAISSAPQPDDTSTSVVAEAEPPAPPPEPPPAPTADDPTSIPDAVEDVVGGVVDTITGGAPPEGHTAPGGVVGADISLNLIGSGTPGAHVSLQAAGQVYATTTIDANGNFVLNATAVPGGLAALELVQVVDRSYLKDLLPGGGSVAELLGTLDGLINALIRPLGLSGNDSPIDIVLLS